MLEGQRDKSEKGTEIEILTAFKLHFAPLCVHWEQREIQRTRQGDRQPKRKDLAFIFSYLTANCINIRHSLANIGAENKAQYFLTKQH